MRITINQRTTNNVTKWRNYCTKLSKNVEVKHQEEPWDRVFTCLGSMKMDNFDDLNSSFCNEIAKKNYRARILTAERPFLSPPIWTSTFLPWPLLPLLWVYLLYGWHLFPNKRKNFRRFRSDVPIRFQALHTLTAGAARSRKIKKPVRKLISNRLNCPWIKIYKQNNR